MKVRRSVVGWGGVGWGWDEAGMGSWGEMGWGGAGRYSAMRWGRKQLAHTVAPTHLEYQPPRISYASKAEQLHLWPERGGME